MRKFFHDNGLTIVLLLLFLFSLAGQYLTGYAEFNEDRETHGRPEISHAQYFGEGHFIEAVFENWESEFLQMGMFIILTTFLYQKGSAESKDPDKIERVDLIPEQSKTNQTAPSPVRRGGLLLKIYQNSLSLAFLTLFLISFALHAYGGAQVYNQEQAEHGESERVSTVEYLATSRFWFESFQNWQSEFLSIAAMVYLTIYLRQKGSPESKAVDAPHDDTGEG
ncbi:MAG: hypothetical protein H0U87_05055 [Acidobacteria bacterium]|jgi:hypothetical protein|nr:hypothetical protein [Acidobacteriota bacterium]